LKYNEKRLYQSVVVARVQRKPPSSQNTAGGEKVSKWRIAEYIFFIALGAGMLLFLTDRLVSGLVFFAGGLLGVSIRYYIHSKEQSRSQ